MSLEDLLQGTLNASTVEQCRSVDDLVTFSVLVAIPPLLFILGIGAQTWHIIARLAFCCCVKPYEKMFDECRPPGARRGLCEANLVAPLTIPFFVLIANHEWKQAQINISVGGETVDMTHYVPVAGAVLFCLLTCIQSFAEIAVYAGAAWFATEGLSVMLRTGLSIGIAAVVFVVSRIERLRSAGASLYAVLAFGTMFTMAWMKRFLAPDPAVCGGHHDAFVICDITCPLITEETARFDLLDTIYAAAIPIAAYALGAYVEKRVAAHNARAKTAKALKLVDDRIDAKKKEAEAAPPAPPPPQMPTPPPMSLAWSGRDKWRRPGPSGATGGRYTHVFDDDL